MRTTYTDKEIKAYLKEELRGYLAKIGPLTAEEKKELHEWVASGRSVYSNPYCLYDDSGYTMEFISGLRVGNDIREDPSDCIRGSAAGYAGNPDRADPF